MSKLYNTLLQIILKDIIPATKISIQNGNKIFGAAILSKKDLSILIVGTNNEIINPLFHGEISAINKFYHLNLHKRIDTKDCIFLSTHEPCSLCLSAITWSGFDNFYYFFPYSDTQNKFNIPHDIKILKEVFKLNDVKYNKNNEYWNSYSIIDENRKLNIKEKLQNDIFIEKIYQEYEFLSEFYQKMKINNKIPLK
tara:strand:- start:92 stop:679 length:588 start_codon:yes stop_codon:yes gene_type:complete